MKKIYKRGFSFLTGHFWKRLIPKMFLDQNYFKFYIGKKLFHKAFQKNGKHYLTGRVLDVGSGSAPYKDDLPECRFITLEHDVRFQPMVVGSAVSLPFLSEAFNSVICTEVLEHLPEPEMCIIEIKRVLKGGGRVYITTPMTWYLHYEPNDYFRFTPYGLRYLLEKNGFTVITLEPIGGLAAILGMVAFEKFYNLIFKLAFFVPKAYRAIVVAPFTLPLSWVLYHLTSLLDHFSKRWVFSVCLVAEKRG